MSGVMIERTAAGTVRCVYCKAEWIGTVADGHSDPACMMWVLRADAFPDDDKGAVSPNADV